MANAQFAVLNEEDFSNLDAGKDSASTKRTVKRSVALFREFLGENSDFESSSKEDLNCSLRRFFGSVRRKDGSELKKSSLVALKYGITKHLKEVCDIDIQTEPLFSGCLNTFKGKMTDLKKKGKGSVQHKLEITSKDLEKLNSPDNLAFNINTPAGLQKKVWFDLMFFMCRRGQENLRSMTKETFSVAVDSTGAKYVHQTLDEADKNHRGDANPDDTIGEARMYERRGDDRCPVKNFELYISKLHPSLNALWQRPLDSFRDDSNLWYMNSPVGKNGLGNWMADISVLAGLSCRYTNHCIRATSTSILDRAGHEARHIMRVTGHKAEASIRSYSRRLTEEQQRLMSNSLGSALSKPIDENQIDAISYDNAPDENQPPPNLELSEVELDNIFMNMEVQNNNVTSCINNDAGARFNIAPTLHNCVVHFNFKN